MSRRPVIVGVGQHTHRPDVDGDVSQDPVALISRATQFALNDASLGFDVVPAIDHLEVVDVLSWRYDPSTAHAVATTLGAKPAAAVDTPVGGEQPVAALDRISARIASGEVRVALLCGAEAAASLLTSRRAKTRVEWPAKPPAATSLSTHIENTVHPQAWLHGLRSPVSIYPLFENAYRAERGQQLAAAQHESSELWSEMSRVAAGNEHAWFHKPRSIEEIGTPTADNRWIYFPYTKLMTAAPNVDQAAALLIMSEKAAVELEVPPDRWVYPRAAAGAVEIADPLSRPSFSRSAAMEVSLRSALERAGLQATDLDLVELYSCFPVVPKMARDYLGRAGSVNVSVSGGLRFFGGPGNGYMLHAIADTVRALRRGQADADLNALLYGQGEFVTKHHAVVLATRAGGVYCDGARTLPEQHLIAENAGPGIDSAPVGRARVETFTAYWTPGSDTARAILVGRLLDSDRRFIATTAPEDQRSARTLITEDGDFTHILGCVQSSDRGNTFALD